MGTPQENPEGYRDSSPVNFAAGLQGKLLIAHATGDDNVHFANTVELAESLVNAQKYAEYQIYAGRGHGISDAAGPHPRFQSRHPILPGESRQVAAQAHSSRSLFPFFFLVGLPFTGGNQAPQTAVYVGAPCV